MEDFLRNLRKKYEDEGRIPKMNVDTVKIVIEEEWKEFIHKENMQPSGATMRILSEHGFLVEDVTFFFQGLLTLLKLNRNFEIPSWDAIVYLKNETLQTFNLLTEEQITLFENREGFDRNHFKN